MVLDALLATTLALISKKSTWGCPQFDIQHADLTAKEHLLFYARLKGAKWRREKDVVEKALKQVKKKISINDYIRYTDCLLSIVYLLYINHYSVQCDTNFMYSLYELCTHTMSYTAKMN